MNIEGVRTDDVRQLVGKKITRVMFKKESSSGLVSDLCLVCEDGTYVYIEPVISSQSLINERMRLKMDSPTAQQDILHEHC